MLKGIAEELLDYLGYNGRYSLIANKEFPKEFHPGQTALISVNNDEVGILRKSTSNCNKRGCICNGN